MNSLKHGLGKFLKTFQENFLNTKMLLKYLAVHFIMKMPKKNSVTFLKAERCCGISISNPTGNLFQDKN